MNEWNIQAWGCSKKKTSYCKLFYQCRNKKIKIPAGYIAKKIRQQKPPEHLKP